MIQGRHPIAVPAFRPFSSKNFSFGSGYADARAGGNTRGLWAGQAGADPDYRMGAINPGLAAACWQGTANRTLAPRFKGADNTLIEAKIDHSLLGRR